MSGGTSLDSRAKIRKMTVCAMLTALIWLLTFTPIGFTIPFFGISMTFVHIPAIIGAMMEGFSGGLLLSFMFGLASFVKNLISPTSIYSYMLQNPLVSILPRLLVGPAVYGAHILIKRCLPGKNTLRWAVCGVVGALTNTVCTLTAFTLCAKLGGEAFSAVTTTSVWALAANCPIECLSAAVLGVAVMSALSRVYKQ